MTPPKRTLFQVATDIADQLPEQFADDHEGAKLLLDDHIREVIRAGYDIERQFDEILERLKLELRPVADLFSDGDLRYIIGTEIAWKNYTDSHVPSRDPEGDRKAFIDGIRFGDNSILGAEGSVEKLLFQLEEYRKNWSRYKPLGFGIPELDSAYGGIFPGEICVLTGAPGTMKTSLAISAVNSFMDDCPDRKVYYCSVDMIPRAITMRLMERESGYSRDFINSIADKNPDLHKKIRAMVQKKYGGRITIRGHKNAQRMTIDALLMECLVNMPGFIVVDYLTQLKTPGQSDLEFIELAMPKILHHAQQYQTPFLLLSQMGRSSRSEQAETGRFGGHGKGGGMIEELANTEIELSQQHSDGNPPMVVAAVTKARNGIAGQYFSLDYDGPTKKFTGSATRLRRIKPSKPVFEQATSFYGGSVQS
jgi:hypothetical protein